MTVAGNKLKAWLNGGILSFCMTAHNETDIVLLKDKLVTLPHHALLQIQDSIDGVTRDGQEAFGREVREFTLNRILEFNTSSDEPEASEYFSAMYDAIESMTQVRSGYPEMASRSEVRRAYMEFIFAMLNVYEFGLPMDERMIKTVHCVDAPSYRMIRSDAIVALVCRHPEKWEQIKELILSHNIRHATALEALLEGHVKSSFGSGVL